MYHKVVSSLITKQSFRSTDKVCVGVSVCIFGQTVCESSISDNEVSYVELRIIQLLPEVSVLPGRILFSVYIDLALAPRLKFYYL